MRLCNSHLESCVRPSRAIAKGVASSHLGSWLGATLSPPAFPCVDCQCPCGRQSHTPCRLLRHQPTKVCFSEAAISNRTTVVRDKKLV